MIVKAFGGQSKHRSDIDQLLSRQNQNKYQFIVAFRRYIASFIHVFVTNIEHHF